LQKLLPHDPGAARPPPPRRRKRWLAALAGGILIGALIGRLWPPASGAALLLASRPSGARVEIDGRAWSETTPTGGRGLSAGPHPVKFAADKLQPPLQTIERQVTLQKNERALVNVALPPPTRRVEVRSVPEGASVYLDGRLVVGVTPTTIELT